MSELTLIDELRLTASGYERAGYPGIAKLMGRAAAELARVPLAQAPQPAEPDAALAQSAQAPVVNDQLTTAQAPAQPAPSDPLQSMADDEKRLGLDDSLGAPQPVEPAPSVDAVMSGVMAVAEAAWNDGRDYRATQSENWSAETWDRYNAVRSAVEALARGEQPCA